MAKIVILCDRLNLGGTEVAMRALINKCLADNHKIILLVNEKSGKMINKFPKEVTIEELPIPAKYDLYINRTQKNTLILIWKKFKRKVFRLFKNDVEINQYILDNMDSYKESFDVALDFYGYGNILTGYCAQKIQAKKKATWFHDENLMWFQFTEKYLDYFDKWFCVSDAVEKSLINSYGNRDARMEVLYNFIDIDEIKKRAEEVCDTSEMVGDYTILSVGRLAYQKGFDIAIEAARILKERNIDFRWYIIGNGVEYVNLRQKIQDYSLGDWFVLLGERDNPYPFMKKCDLYVQPSRHEGYGITLLEARTLCRPIIATDIDSFKEQIIHGHNGLLSTLEASDIADAIIKIRNQDGLSEKMVANLKQESSGFEEYYQKFKQFIDLY